MSQNISLPEKVASVFVSYYNIRYDRDWLVSRGKVPTDTPEVTTVYEQVVGQIANVRFTTEYERIGI